MFGPESDSVRVMRLLMAIALPVLILAVAAGGYAFRPTAAPQQLAPQSPRTVQPTSVTTFRHRWEALGEQAAAIQTRNRSFESVAASTGPMALAEDLPQQIERSPLSRKRAARVAGGEVCARHGLRRVDYRKNGHLYWRCA
jgi:hypothetical protein